MLLITYLFFLLELSQNSILNQNFPENDSIMYYKSYLINFIMQLPLLYCYHEKN